MPTKTIPDNYTLSGSVTLKSSKDMALMLVWSVVLLLLSGVLVGAVLMLMSQKGISIPGIFNVGSLTDILALLGGLVLVTVVMVVIHEGLHGLVFWIITRERPKFAFKWYYASACAEGWYLPRRPFLIATLLPLMAITAVGLALLPFFSVILNYLLVLLIVFNASGCAGDVVVALRLCRLPEGTLALDSGDEVHFYSPAPSIRG